MKLYAFRTKTRKLLEQRKLPSDFLEVVLDLMVSAYEEGCRDCCRETKDFYEGKCEMLSPDAFTEAYLKCALWSSNDEDENPLDKDYAICDFDEDSLRKMCDDCEKFQRENAEDIVGRKAQAGHDFWLTRNGHGSGFWDGDWDEEIEGHFGKRGERLTQSSEKFGECVLYKENGKIFVL